MSRTCFRTIGFALAVLFLLTAGPAAAQQQLGTIQGTITDDTHAVLPGVTVTVTNLDTGTTRTATTNDLGIYRVPSLDPGRYKVQAELQGFSTATQTNVTVSVGATLGMNFTLKPGTVSETVQVSGIAPDIQTEKADLSAVVEKKKIEDLPLVGRNVLSLAALQPGINGIPSTADIFATEQGLGITANGVRDTGNSTTVDGASINNGPWGGTVLLVPNVEAVQEFQVIANNPSAEYGRNSGAMVSVITKGGTNVVAGSVFEFHRDQGLRDKGFFEAKKAPFSRNDYGGSVGGPIKKDSTFFFFSYEGVREQTPNSFNATVETQQLVDWVNANRPNSNAAKLLNKYKPPSYPTTGQDLGSPLPGANVWSTTPDGIPDIGTIAVTTSGPRRGDQFNGRFDQVLRGNKDRLRGTYYFSRSQGWYTYVRPQFDHPYPFRDQVLNVQDTTIISNQTLNEATFGFARQDGHAGDPTPDAPTLAPGNGVAGFGVEFWHPIEFTQMNYQIKDVVTLNRGAHAIRTGGEARLGHDGATLHHWQRPNYGFQSILDFVDDEAFSETRAVDPATGQSTTAYGNYITNEWGLFVQDNWKVRSNMTLNLGLRYDNFGNPAKDKLAFNGIILGSGSTIQEQIANAKVGKVDQLYKTDWNNFAPRLGITWDPGGNGRLVLRSGGGISYNRLNNTTFSDERLNPPQFAQAVATIQNGVPIVYSLGPTYPANPALGRGLNAAGGIQGARVALRVIDPSIQTPKYYNWFAGVQHQLPWNMVADATYNGSAGRELTKADGPTSEDYNRFAGDMADGVRNRLNPYFDSVDFNRSVSRSNYNGVSVQLQRRYSRGWSAQGVYTVGVSRDLPAVATEVTNPDFDYGYANNDVRHRVAMNFIFEVPGHFSNAALDAVLGGWQVNGLGIFQSGMPFSVSCTQAYPRCDFNMDGTNNDRVNMPSYGTDFGNPTQAEWVAGVMKASDFTYPAFGSLSDQPRNAFRGPGYKNMDLSLVKNFQVPGAHGAQAARLQLRIEAFNAFNWVNLSNPNGSITAGTFGRVTGTRSGPRVLQIGAKYIF